MSDNFSILSSCTSGGCGAKIDPETLSDILHNLPKLPSDRLLVGYDTSDDGAVYEIDEENCLISTLDFFSPMVDNPYDFGEIAAANALSDVYAMGGKVLYALNIVCFPEKLPQEILKEILKGGSEKVSEAGGIIAGGHSIYDKEPKYGLSVTGVVKKSEIIRNNTPQVGDKLILTKPLGVGIIMAAARVSLASDIAIKAATDSMKRLNKYAAEKMSYYDVHACTDITGFGLLLHLAEMCGDSVSAKIYVNKLPILPEALEYAEEYILTAAGQRNRSHFSTDVNLDNVPFGVQEVLFDPQTSGGLLISVSATDGDELLAKIKAEDSSAEIVGEITSKNSSVVVF